MRISLSSFKYNNITKKIVIFSGQPTRSILVSRWTPAANNTVLGGNSAAKFSVSYIYFFNK